MQETKLLIRALKGEVTERVPFWFMRQAGRYLPEYKALRATTSGFMDLCFTPEKAAEVTLQPIRRFDMDAAILFSDILVIPHALGANVRFAEGEGPIVEQTITEARIGALRSGDVKSKLAPVFETVRLVRRELAAEKALIGFAGSPWTVACYMLEGERRKKEFENARRFVYQGQLLQKLIDTIADATIDYLRLQVDAGADALQIFGSWDGLLPNAVQQYNDKQESLEPSEFYRYAIEPVARIVTALKQTHPHIPIVGFPKGVGGNLADYARATKVDALGVDQHTPMEFAIAARAHANQAVQGNIDPLLVARHREQTLHRADEILRSLKHVPAIFNLGHGFVPDTPIENVEALSALVKNYRR